MITNVKLMVAIDSGNDALVSDPVWQLSSIFTGLTLRLDSIVQLATFEGVASVPIRDANGQQIGSASLTVDTDDEEETP